MIAPQAGDDARYAQEKPQVLSLVAICPDTERYAMTEAVRYAGPDEAGDPRVGDLYRPKGDGPWPAVLVIHGGSWQRGSRAEMAKFARRCARLATQTESH